MQTVIGVFDDRIAAARALEILRTSGFDDDHVQLQGKPFVSEPAGQPPEPDETDDGVLGAMSHFLTSIFGHEDKQNVDVIEEAVRRGGYVVTVDAFDEEEAEAVEALLGDTGAIDIDERAEQWKNEGATEAQDGVDKNDWPRSRVPKGDL
jgi:hypothetical protein